MKNLSIISLLLVCFVQLTSCKKDYSCQCNYEEAHEDHFDDASIVYPLGKLTKQDAENQCNDKGLILSSDEDHQNIDCKIKK